MTTRTMTVTRGKRHARKETAEWWLRLLVRGKGNMCMALWDLQTGIYLTHFTTDCILVWGH